MTLTLHYLLKWITARTRIQGRIAGRTLYLDDSGIMDSPMLYLTGEKTTLFTQAEKRTLRRYLVEKGGFIFAQHNHNHGPPSYRGFANSMRAQFREIILSAGGQEIQPIPQNHPIWQQPFPLGGQPRCVSTGAGADHSTVTYPMVAFELDGRLSVVISYNDYDNGWKLPGTRQPGSDPTYIPSALRMGVNFIFYAGTHGKISDYKHYVPQERWRDEDILLPRRIPQSAYTLAPDFEKE